MLFKGIHEEVLKEAIRPWLHGGAKVVSDELTEELKAQLSQKVQIYILAYRIVSSAAHGRLSLLSSLPTGHQQAPRQNHTASRPCPTIS